MGSGAVNSGPGWTWGYDAYVPERERRVEALCTLGNGRFATRGSAPECAADTTHYPGTYLAGCYDRRTSLVDGREVENEDLVNLPNWTLLRYRRLPEDEPAGEWLTPDSDELRHYAVRLDLRRGVLHRSLYFQDAGGRGLRVGHTRLVHMGDPGLAAQRTTFHAYGWSGEIEVESVLDGDVANTGVERYHHFRPEELSALFARLGHRLDDETWRATVDYYLRRTSHGSTLSSLVHGWVLARLKGAGAWRYCEEALLSDVADVQGGTTGEGIHLGAMAGTIDLVERGITGLEAGPDGLRVAPVSLRQLPRFAFTLCCGGHRGVRLRVLPGRLGVRVPAGPGAPLALVLPGDRRFTVPPGEERWFPL